ncbi:hypothetical protein [Arhodomonas sp. SL1]|uniref:hypothetical protein n=1 Tax=Arhodomonas sp. SL1 TaxID=3425691 RepID=UPI003F883B87
MSKEEAGTEPTGAPWQAAALGGVAVLAVLILVLALGGTTAVAIILSAIALALATVIVMVWPQRFGVTPNSGR